MVKNKDYVPVATVVPTEDSVPEADALLLLEEDPEATFEPMEPPSMTTNDGTIQLHPELLAAIPRWRDTYFSVASNSSHHACVAVFDFDSKAMIANSFRLNSMLMILFGVVVYYKPELFFPWIFIGGFLSWNARRAAIGTYTSCHLGLTQDGVLLVHERHRTWFGMRGRVETFVPFTNIRVIEPSFASGNMFLCFDFSIHRIQLRERRGHWSMGSDGLLMDIRGVTEAKVLVEILHRITHAEIHGSRNALRSRAIASAPLDDSGRQPLLQSEIQN